MKVTKDNFISVLENAGVILENVQFSMSDDYVRLDGIVPDADQVELVSEILGKCKEFGEIINNLAVEGEEDDIFAALDEAEICTDNIEITYDGTKVIVDGTVPVEDDIERVTEIVESCKGYTEVENNLTFEESEADVVGEG